MNLLHVLILAVVQGVAELLPVSSSAHVILAEKLLGLDATSPDMTLLLVMLHTGTMFAVIAYFWQTWRETYFASTRAFRLNGLHVVLATVATGVVSLILLQLIKHFIAASSPNFEIEQLFGNPKVMASGLAAAGLLIIMSSRRDNVQGELSARSATWVGAVQGLCLPFRGFSRSGATISSALLLGVGRQRAEAFSFALAVVLTPAVIAKEGYRFYQAHAAAAGLASAMHLMGPIFLGMILSFFTGLGALRWLSRWLERGRWHLFGAYCLAAALVVFIVG